MALFSGTPKEESRKMIAIAKITMDLKNHKKINIYVKLKRKFGEELGESLKTTKKINYSNNVFDIVWSLLVWLRIASTQVKITTNTLCISKGLYFIFLVTYELLLHNLFSTSQDHFEQLFVSALNSNPQSVHQSMSKLA